MKIQFPEYLVETTAMALIRARLEGNDKQRSVDELTQILHACIHASKRIHGDKFETVMDNIIRSS